MASDLISRKALMGDLLRVFCEDCNSYNGIRCRACLMDDVIGYVEAQPTVDAVEVVHGEWDVNFEGDNIVYCNQCYIPQCMETPCCPNCGAKMDGEEM